MTKIFLSLFITLLFTVGVLAQNQDVQKLHESAKTYMRQGDFNNAVLLLTRALQSQPDNLELLKDLAFSYYLKKDLVRALETAKPFADRKDADVQSYQILAMVYKALEERKETERLYKAALKKYPNSGALYNEYGEMLWDKKEYSSAVKQWEKGIQADPNHSGNYYNAARYYYFSADRVWGLFYGEIFVNIESYSDRTEEIKKLLLDGYKKLFTGNDVYKNQDTKNEFVKAFLETMKKNEVATANGINPESITTLRARFLLDWYTKYATRFPHRLFEHQQQMVKMGLFDAYNQWIFGAAQNASNYEKWTAAHGDAHNEFLRLQKNRVFKVPVGQYYQTPAK
jgi:tetratricopeptide (TPR) repeat protein